MKKLLILFCVLWMGFIFYMSSMPGTESYSESNKVTNLIQGKETGKSSTVKSTVPQSNDLKKPLSKVEQDEIKAKQAVLKAKIAEDKKKQRTLNHIVRKNAHMLEYIVLAFLISITFFAFNVKGKAAIINILFICLLYAVSDEFHQSFILGRGSLVSDVILDFSGAFFGMVLFYTFYYKVRKIRNTEIKL